MSIFAFLFLALALVVLLIRQYRRQQQKRLSWEARQQWLRNTYGSPTYH